MSIRIFAFIYALVGFVSFCSATEVNKLENIQRAQSIRKAILDIAKKEDAVYQKNGKLSQSQYQDKIKRILRNENNADTLFRIAIDCFYASYPGQAGDEGSDFGFQIGWDVSISKLVQLGNSQALEKLEDLKHLLPLDGETALTIEDSIKEVRRKVGRYN